MALMLAVLMPLSACAKASRDAIPDAEPDSTPEVEVDVDVAQVADGVYRGSFTDPKQVEVEFEIKDNTFTSFKFRALGYRDANYLKNDDAAVLAVGQQYVDLGDYLVGKDFSALKDL